MYLTIDQRLERLRAKLSKLRRVANSEAIPIPVPVPVKAVRRTSNYRYCVRCPDGAIKTRSTQKERGWKYAVIEWRTDYDCPRWVFWRPAETEAEAQRSAQFHREMSRGDVRVEPLFVVTPQEH